MDLGGDIAEIGGAIGSLFTSKGNAAEAQSYSGAAQLEQQNAQLTATSTKIQSVQEARTVSQSLGATRADVAGAGFTESGSALDILRSSAQQGSLATSLINIQGAINENAYAAEAGADLAKAKAANEADKAGTINAIASIGGALVSATGQLASAGKTIAQGYNFVNSVFSGTATTPGLFGSTAAAQAAAGVDQGVGVFVNAAGDSVAAGTPGAIELGSTVDASQVGILFDTPGALSATDGSIAAGANFGELAGTTDIGVDTSAVPLGATTEEVSAGITSGLAQFAGIAGGAFAGFELGSMIGKGTGKAIAEGVGAVIGAVAGAEAVGIPVLAIATAALTVLCTSFYKRGMVPREVWLGSQRYGQQLNPITFAGYLHWASPIARKITKDEWFAKLMGPIFIPSANEMAYVMGVEGVKRTVYGFASHKLLLGISWCVGQMIKGDKYVTARS